MKPGKRVTKRSKKRVRITSLQASAETPRRGVKSKITRKAPPLRDWIVRYGEYYKPRKLPVTLRLDADFLAWVKKKGRGYQTRINNKLREWMMEETKSD